MQAETTPGRVALLRDRMGGSQLVATESAVAVNCGPPAWGAAILAAHWDNGRLARYDPPYLIRNIVPAW